MRIPRLLQLRVVWQIGKHIQFVAERVANPNKRDVTGVMNAVGITTGEAKPEFLAVPRSGLSFKFFHGHFLVCYILHPLIYNLKLTCLRPLDLRLHLSSSGKQRQKFCWILNSENIMKTKKE